MISSYKELTVWQKSMKLVRLVYETTRQMPKDELYGLTNQMRRAAVSIPSNIAEGQQRKNLKEYLQFIRISYGSAAELETQIFLVKDLYPHINVDSLETSILEIRKMLNGLLKSLENPTCNLEPVT